MRFHKGGSRAPKIPGEVRAAEGITVRAGSAVENIKASPNGPGFLPRLNGSSEVAATHLLDEQGNRCRDVPPIVFMAAWLRFRVTQDQGGICMAACAGSGRRGSPRDDCAWPATVS